MSGADERVVLAYDHCRVCTALELVRKLSLWDGAEDMRKEALRALTEVAKAIESKQGEAEDKESQADEQAAERAARKAAGRCVECGAAGGDARGRHHYSDCSRKKR